MKRLDSLWSLGLLFTATTQAGGLYLYETGTDDVGLASAGMVARAQDATVQFLNPAGLSRLSGHHLTMAGQALYGDIPYDLTDPAYEDVDTVVGWFPSASIYYSQQLDEQWSMGFATYGNFGLGLDYGDWAGQQLVQQATLVALTMQPSLAYRIDEQWSIGAGFGLNYGLFALKREAINGERKLDDSDWAIDGKFGVLYELTPATRFGLGYSSQTKYQFDTQTQVTLQLPNMPGISAQLPISGLVNSPQQLMVSGYHEFAPDWALMANLGWQEWSHYNNNDVSIVGINTANKGLFQDTYHLAVGLQHTLTPQWALNSGLAYDSSVYKEQENTSLTIPSGAAVRIGVGAKYLLNAKEHIGAAMEYIDQESASVQAGGLSGNYDNPKIYLFAVNYSRQF